MKFVIIHDYLMEKRYNNKDICFYYYKDNLFTGITYFKSGLDPYIRIYYSYYFNGINVNIDRYNRLINLKAFI